MPLETSQASDFAMLPTDFAGQVHGAQVASTQRRGKRDVCAIQNERVKMLCSFLNTIALTLIVFALLRPVILDMSLVTAASFLWVGLGVGLHALAHVLLGRLVAQ